MLKSLIFFICFILCGCSNAKDSVIKSDGLRIISLSPAGTEILFALGLQDKIIGVTSFCDYPKEAKLKEKIGSFTEPNTEKIISLKPNLIISVGNFRLEKINRLKKLGLNVHIYDPKNIKGLIETINSIGALTGKVNEGKMLNDSINLRIAKVQAEVAKIPYEKRLKVYIEISSDPIFSAGKGSFIDEVINLAGGVNITSDLKYSYSAISPEVVVKRNPDFIFLGYMIKNTSDIEMVKHRLGWENISAVKNDRVYNDLDPDIFLKLGPRIVDGIEIINKRIYGGI